MAATRSHGSESAEGFAWNRPDNIANSQDSRTRTDTHANPQLPETHQFLLDLFMDDQVRADGDPKRRKTTPG